MSLEDGALDVMVSGRCSTPVSHGIAEEECDRRDAEDSTILNEWPDSNPKARMVVCYVKNGYEHIPYGQERSRPCSSYWPPCAPCYLNVNVDMWHGMSYTLSTR